jgi:hypothetical protein
MLEAAERKAGANQAFAEPIAARDTDTSIVEKRAASAARNGK